MTIDSFDVVFYTALFILPGFVINNIVNQINPPPRHNDSIFFLKCFGYSIVSCAVWCWLYLIVIKSPCMGTGVRWLLLAIISLLGSAMIGFIIALAKYHQWIDHGLWHFKVKTIHHTPTAWDYYFSQQEPVYMIITLVDDTLLLGWYSTHSFTSSDPDERDIYVEKAYRLEGDQWVTDEQSAGFYISKDQIKVIEFKKGDNNNAGEQKKS